MVKNLFYTLVFVLVLPILMVACQEDEQLDNSAQMSFSVGGSMWSDGLGATRAVADPVALTPVPEQLTVRSNRGKSFVIYQTNSTDDNYKEGYTPFHASSIPYLASAFKEGETLKAYYPNYFDKVPDGYCGFDDYLSSNDTIVYKSITKDGKEIDINHAYFEMHHRCALVRIFLSLSQKYDSIRVVTIDTLGIAFRGFETKRVFLPSISKQTPYQVYTEDKDPETQSGNASIWFYVEPRDVRTDAGNPLTLTLSYNVFAKNEVEGGSVLTRRVDNSQVALNVKNKITNDNLERLNAGFYYDYHIQIDPDFLYTLSDNDEPTVVE